MAAEPFEPEIVAFCCNWCSYAGADLAGVSRIQYPPNMRIIRVMCSGRVEMGHIVRAFELGADGVLVAGCHIGDCHYISGNEKAERVIGATREVLDVLGLGDRLRLEWISAAEGARFGETVSEFTEHVRALGPSPVPKASDMRGRGAPDPAPDDVSGIVNATGVYNCLECGKCEASCPITRMEVAYSPMLIVEEALRELSDELGADRGLWTCITCGLCSERCPSGVDFLEFIRQVRDHEGPGCARCAHGGTFHSLSGLMAFPEVSQPGRLYWVTDDLEVASEGEVVLFTGCIPYQERVLWDIEVEPVEVLRSTVRLLNAAGIVPVVMEDERCCGHDLLWSGMAGEAFASLARLNVEAIRRTGAKRVVFACPEGYRTFSRDYGAVLGGEEMGFELLHSSELLAGLVADGSLELPEGGGDDATPLTFQDPCRLGRHMGVVDAPREVLSALPDHELVEMEHSGLNAHCCGTSSWLNCGTFSKRIQLERLGEAEGAGAGLMVTACPKCLAHFNCALREPEGQGQDLPPKPGVEVVDLSVLLAETLGLTGGGDG